MKSDFDEQQFDITNQLNELRVYGEKILKQFEMVGESMYTIWPTKSIDYREYYFDYDESKHNYPEKDFDDVYR